MPREIIWVRANSSKQVMAARSHALTLHSCVTLMHAHARTATLISICPNRLHIIVNQGTTSHNIDVCLRETRLNVQINRHNLPLQRDCCLKSWLECPWQLDQCWPCPDAEFCVCVRSDFIGSATRLRLISIEHFLCKGAPGFQKSPGVDFFF